MDLNDPIDVLTRTAIGEADADGINAMQAVMNVVVNRANHPEWWGDTILSVCLAPNQFDCWSPGADRTRIEALSPGDHIYRTARPLAALAIRGLLPDLTQGADSYYSEYAGQAAPAWAVQNPGKFTVQIGRERFYRLEAPSEKLDAAAPKTAAAQAAAIIEADAEAGGPVVSDKESIHD